MKHIFKSTPINPGDRKRNEKENLALDIKLHVHKFSSRRRPNSKNIVVFPVFSEFGSEILIPTLCLPALLQRKYAGRYTIVVGWHGRSYLYKHLVDEFWELDKAHQNLREYSRAFHHDSKILKVFERRLTAYGKVIDIKELASVTVFPVMEQCPVTINDYTCKGQIIPLDDAQFCVKCGTRFGPVGAFFDMKRAMKEVRWIPDPSEEKTYEAARLIPPKSVGIIGRSRKCYGRNLDSDFYKRLILLVEDLGYNVLWMGEKGVSLPCPMKHVQDFTKHPNADDLELTLAVVKQLAFTIQFWTASTRLAGLMGTPFILFESPDQLWGAGQEGYRLNLCSKGPKKIVAAQFLTVVENLDKALQEVKESIYDIEDSHFQTRIGPVENERTIREMIMTNNLRVGFLN